MAHSGAQAGDPMAVEDQVVSTWPVFLVRNPDPGGALYLLQSPLRPAARPYALEECDEVRFKVRTRRDATRCAQQPRRQNPRAAADMRCSPGEAGAHGAGPAAGHAFRDV